MKLKNILVLAFLILTLIPIMVASLLLYKSGYELSRESYMRNLEESINVQADYISQTIENNMIADYRFVGRSYVMPNEGSQQGDIQKPELLDAFQAYLEASEDKIAACILINHQNVPVYSIGEKAVLDTIQLQLPPLQELTEQVVMEFNLGNGVYSLGTVTPMRDSSHNYTGSLVSVYDKSYIFKIISSYYEIADTSTYICRKNGDVVNFRGVSDEVNNDSVRQELKGLTLDLEGTIDMRSSGISLSGYYKNIHNSPWYLIGFVDHDQVHSFTNQFILIYILIIAAVCIADIFLSLYFSRKVVEPINDLISVMEGYQSSMNSNDLKFHEKSGYFETRYLRTKFLGLMKAILLVQHNFEGVYQLYQSNTMDDTNIDIDVKNQTIHSNKEPFQKLMDQVTILEADCVVDKFIKCFCEKDQLRLTEILEGMRDQHLSVACEIEVFTAQPNQKWFHTLVVPMYEDERLSRLFIQLRDISSFKKQEFESIEQARRDSLTGLYNRSGLSERVGEALRDSHRSTVHGLLFIDMNYFKPVNDNFGHHAGDQLLCAIGETLQEGIKQEHIVARVGGDEFAVFLPNTCEEELLKVKAELNRKLIYPFHTEELSFEVSASIGIAMWDPENCNTLEKLLEQADTVMYQAKRDFKENRIKI